MRFAFLALILLAYLVIGGLYATRTPAWQVPDEPAHYNYIAQVANQGCCPVMAPGDWDNDYLETIKREKFSEQALAGRLDTLQYEDWQPPLYYLLGSLVFKLTDGSLIALRLFSVLIGMGVLLVAWMVMRVVFPAQAWLAVGVVAFIAFLPQHVAIMAGVSNDGLAELVIGLILLLSALYVGNGLWRPSSLLLGILFGIGILTKATTYPMIAVIALAVVLRGRLAGWLFSRVLREVTITAVIALLVGGGWWLRNIATYGGLDFMAQAAHDRVVVGQTQASQYIAAQGVSGWLSDGLQTTFQSFWGQFGWMGVPMTDPIYAALIAFTGFTIFGALAAFWHWRDKLTAVQRHALILLGATLLLTLAAFIYYNLKFVQFQGRYLFPALLPISLVVASGLAGWASLVGSFLAPGMRQWLKLAVTALFSVGMAGFAIYALYRIVLPGLV